MPFWMYLLPFVWPAFIIVVLALKALQKRKDALEKQKIEEYIQKKKLYQPSVEPTTQPSVEPSVEPTANVLEDKYMKIWEELPFGEKAYATLTYEERVKFDEWRQYTTLSLDNARERVIKLLLKQDLDKAIEVVVSAYTEAHQLFFAVERHFFITDIIDKFYAMRDVNPRAVDLCLGLCEIDIMNLKYFIEETGRSEFYAISPTRSAIILEKKGKIDEAIEICNKAIELGVLDTNMNPFEIRKARLEKRLEKQKQKEQKEQIRKE